MNIRNPPTVRLFPKQAAYNAFDLLAYANLEFGDDVPPLPLPPMLMLHRIIDINEVGGKDGKGCAVAEYDVRPDDFYFKYHFKNNPLMPGVYGLDSVLQLAGFMLAWTGPRGDGMAVGVDGVKFRNKITPDSATIRIGVEVKQIRPGKTSIIRASGWVRDSTKLISEMDEVVVGVVARKAA